MSLMTHIIGYMELTDLDRYVVDDESERGEGLRRTGRAGGHRVLLRHAQWLLLRVGRPSRSWRIPLYRSTPGVPDPVSPRRYSMG
jgi:hypothetical protein